MAVAKYKFAAALFVSFNFLLSAKYVPYEKDACTSFPSASKYGSFINDITCAGLKLDAKAASRTIKPST